MNCQLKRFVALCSIVVLMCGLLLQFPQGMAHASGGTFQQFTFNGSAGSRTYFVYTPVNYQTGTVVPLIVMLHGCTQTPADFAAGTQMNALADQKQFIVVYPQQPSSANSSECWNWFLPADQARGSGEPAIIAGITQTVIQTTSQWTIDTSRVYVAGMSAGACMAVIMGATYPDIFAAIGVHSGLEYAAATDTNSAFTALSQGGPNPTQQGQAAFNAMGSVARVVPTIDFQGTSDTTVAPINGDQVIQQWMQTDHLASNNTYNASFNSPSTSTNGQVPNGRAFTQSTWNDNNGNEVEEYWKITGMGHAWSGGSTSGSFTDPMGPSATQAMYNFFIAHPQGPTVTASPTGGTFNDSVQVTLTANPSNANIFYTTDGSTPTTSSIRYSGPITISQTTTLNFFAVDSSGHKSAIQSQVYTINNPGPAISASPTGSTFGGPVTVTLQSNESNTTIHYTTDGSTPTTSSATFSSPLKFTQTTTLKYFGVDANNRSSQVQSQTYTITAILVTASPPAGTYSGAQSVSLSMNMLGTIYYTTDGSTPTTSSTKYTGPIKVTASAILKFFGVDQIGNSGTVQSQAYTITSPPPTFSIKLTSIPAEDGSVYQNATDGPPNSVLQYIEVGSTALNHGEIGVLSFDTSKIPAGAKIISATLTIYRYDNFVYNNDLGPITADIAPIGGFSGSVTLQQADYNAMAGQNNIGDFDAVPTQQNQGVSDAISQSALAFINLNGHTQFRLHFQKATNNDNALDVMHFYSGDSGGNFVPVLVVQYQ